MPCRVSVAHPYHFYIEVPPLGHVQYLAIYDIVLWPNKLNFHHPNVSKLNRIPGIMVIIKGNHKRSWINIGTAKWPWIDHWQWYEWGPTRQWFGIHEWVQWNHYFTLSQILEMFWTIAGVILGPIRTQKTAVGNSSLPKMVCFIYITIPIPTCIIVYTCSNGSRAFTHLSLGGGQ